MIPLLRAIAGLIVWALAFSSLYALQGIACTAGLDGVPPAGISLARLPLVALYAFWLALHLWLCWRLGPLRHGPALIDRMAFGLAVVGLVSTAYTGFPVAVTTICT